MGEGGIMMKGFASRRSVCILSGIAILITGACTSARLVSPPVLIEAVAFSGRSGTTSENCSEGGRDVTTIRNGNYLQYSNVNFGNGIQCFEARVANAGGGGYIELHLDNPSGTIIGTCEVRPSTGGWQTWASKACTVNGTSGIHMLYLIFIGGPGNLFNLEWFKLYPAPVISMTGWRQSTSTSIGIYRGTLRFNSDLDSGAVGGGTASVFIDTNTLIQRIDGFGGAFNDNGWVSLQEVSSSAEDSVMRALFDTATGCKFTIGRCPIGMSDFSVDSSSLNDRTNDFAMRFFSIAHDQQYNIPYIREAMKYQKNLMINASPWTPPAWMKTIDTWQGISVDTNRMRQDSRNLASYAVYFRKFVQAFDSAGISITAVFPQNELDVVVADHPSCAWTGTELWNFVRNYLYPELSTYNIPAEIWMGTFNLSDFADDLQPWLGDSLMKDIIRGGGFQWSGFTAMNQMLNYDTSMHLRAMQTENFCHSGANSWADALDMFCNYLYAYFENGANSYLYWNMILNSDPAFVPWMPRYQNSMITVTSSSGTIIYNPEFFVMKHFGYYIKQGAAIMPVTGSNAALYPLAFKNPDGTIITLIANNSDSGIATTIQLGNQYLDVTLPAASISTFNMGGTEDTSNWTAAATTATWRQPNAVTRGATPVPFTIFDIRGRIIRQNIMGTITNKTTILKWDGTDLSGWKASPGVYFATARDAKTATRLLIMGSEGTTVTPAIK
jgi:glucosylceramidase